MPKPSKGPRLGGGPAHERLLLANLANALFEHKSITTTETKAKRLRPLAERLITFAKRGDLHARRRVLSILRNKETTHILFTEIAPLVSEREGGYTRITKLGFRKGDNAPLAAIELILDPVVKKPTSPKKVAAKAAAEEAEKEKAKKAAAAEKAAAEAAAAEAAGVADEAEAAVEAPAEAAEAVVENDAPEAEVVAEEQAEIAEAEETVADAAEETAVAEEAAEAATSADENA